MRDRRALAIAYLVWLLIGWAVGELYAHYRYKRATVRMLDDLKAGQVAAIEAGKTCKALSAELKRAGY